MSITEPDEKADLPEKVAENLAAAALILERCDKLAKLSSMPDAICRTYLSREHGLANEMVSGWLTEAGMSASVDAAGNVFGRYAPAGQSTFLVLGSHLDTVPDAGRYDGILGVLSGIAVVDELKRSAVDLPFGIEVVGFGEEEGVRFGTTLMGSRAFAGTWDSSWLTLADETGTTLQSALESFGLNPRHVGDAAREAHRLEGYLELHIEQGPVLEAEDLPVGVVTGIAGAERLLVTWSGTAAHAGTTPMDLRRDALAAAASGVEVVERTARTLGIVATVGQLVVEPGGMNVVPGKVVMSLDVRSVDAALMQQGKEEILAGLEHIASARGLDIEMQPVHAAAPVACAERLRQAAASAIGGLTCPVFELPSGAGHDAMAIASVCDVGMIFVRCAAGLSHNPAERVSQADVAWGLAALHDTVLHLAKNQTRD